jgi:membrane-anchored protein YejM (alkaline phosphatase superfamily)
MNHNENCPSLVKTPKYQFHQNQHDRFILWRIDPLLGKRLEKNNETTAVAIQWCSKHASIAIELLLETVFSTWSVQRSYKEDSWANGHTMLKTPVLD